VYVYGGDALRFLIDFTCNLQTRTANFYISDRNTGKRFYVRAGEGGKITWMIKQKTDSFDGERKGASRNLKSWMASNDLSCDGTVRVKEG
jgi:hypothetical protein